MTHTYQITGMTCSGCEAKVKTLLQAVPGINQVAISLAEGTAELSMGRHVPTATLQAALAAYPKYHLTEAKPVPGAFNSPEDTEARTWLQTYQPILLIAAYLLVVALIGGSAPHGFSALTAMRLFMSGFFLVFSFFKLLDLPAFADSYAMYDLVAKRFRSWGYIYAFIELTLGVLYALNSLWLITNLVTLVVMSVSLIGVVQSVMNKRQIRCACLGAVFNLPMSTVTIIEDGLMIMMSLVMLPVQL